MTRTRASRSTHGWILIAAIATFAVSGFPVDARRVAAEEPSVSAPSESDASAARAVFEIDHDDPSVRRRAHAALVASGESAWPAIEAAWDTGTWRTRDRLAAVLGDLDFARADTLRRSAMRDPSWAVRATASRASASPGTSELGSGAAESADLSALRERIDDPVWAVRHAAVSALATYDDPSVAPALARVLHDDPDADVAARAGRLLLDVADTIDRETLELLVRRALSDDRESTLDRIFARRDTTGDVESFFRDRLDSDDPRHRLLAACWLVREGDTTLLDEPERFAAIARAAAGDADGALADRAATTLLLLGPNAAPSLVALLPELESLDTDRVFHILHSLLGEARNASLVPLLVDPRLEPHRDTILAHLAPISSDDDFTGLQDLYRRLPSAATTVDPLRANLLRRLARTRPEAMRAELMRELGHTDARTRLVAIEELLRSASRPSVATADSEDTATLPLVLDALARETAGFVRGRAIDAVASLGDDAASAWIRTVAHEDVDPRNRRKALQTFADRDAIPAAARLEFLLARLDDEVEPEVRSAVVVAIGRFEGSAVTAKLEALAFSVDEPWGVRRAAYDRLRRRADATSLDRLLARIDSADRTRELTAIADALAEYDDPRVCTKFRTLIDTHPPLRTKLVELLGRAGCRDEIARLASHVTNTGWSLRDRIAATEHLARIETPAALDALVEATRESCPFELRLTAIGALAERREDRALTVLRESAASRLATCETHGRLAPDATAEDANLLIETLVALVRRGSRDDLARAISIAVRALAETPDETARSIWSGTLVRILRAGDRDDARTLFESELARRDAARPYVVPTPQSILETADGLRRTREHDLAAVAYSFVLETGPTTEPADFDAARRLAAWHERTERFGPADRAFGRAFAIAVLHGLIPSDEVEAPLQGFLPIARLRGFRDVCRALRQAPQSTAQATLARFEAALASAGGDREIALACAQFAIDLDLDPGFARRAAELTYRIEPEDPRVSVTRAEALAYDGATSEAAEAYERFAAGPVLDGASAAAHYLRAAELRLAAGNLERALADLASALANDPSAATAILARPAFAPLRDAGQIDDRGRPTR